MHIHKPFVDTLIIRCRLLRHLASNFFYLYFDCYHKKINSVTKSRDNEQPYCRHLHILSCLLFTLNHLLNANYYFLEISQCVCVSIYMSNGSIDFSSHSLNANAQSGRRTAITQMIHFQYDFMTFSVFLFLVSFALN